VCACVFVCVGASDFVCAKVREGDRVHELKRLIAQEDNVPAESLVSALSTLAPLVTYSIVPCSSTLYYTLWYPASLVPSSAL
jgi:hypothetical protein